MDYFNEHILSLFENKDISNKMLIHMIYFENVKQINLDYINKTIKNKYGKDNIKYFRFPCDNDCMQAKVGHNDCICMSFYCRPKF